MNDPRRAGGLMTNTPHFMILLIIKHSSRSATGIENLQRQPRPLFRICMGRNCTIAGLKTCVRFEVAYLSHASVTSP